MTHLFMVDSNYSFIYSDLVLLSSDDNALNY